MTGKRWTQEEKQLLIELYPNTSNKEISERVGRSYYTIGETARVMGLKKTHEYKSWATTSTRTIHAVNHNYFHNIDTPEKAYWLGWWWSDGCLKLYKNRKSIAITIHSSDIKIIEMFKRDIGATQPIFSNKFEHVGIQISSKVLFDDLVSHGVVPRKSLLAEEPIGIPDNLLSHFVRGEFDGDGWIGFSNDKYQYPNITITGTEAFCRWLNEAIFQKLGFYGRLRNTKCPSNMTWAYDLSKHADISLFANWMYQDCGEHKLDRKYNKFVGRDLI